MYPIIAGIVYFFVGLGVFIPFSPKEHHHHWTEGATWAISFWLGPFALAALVFGLALAWDNRPRRVLVPIKEDLRKATDHHQ